MGEPQGEGQCSMSMTVPTCDGQRLPDSECLLDGPPAWPSGDFHQVPSDPEKLEGARLPPQPPPTLAPLPPASFSRIL